MKTFKLMSFLTVLLLISSCANESSGSLTTNATGLRNPLEYIGVIHNNYLAEFTKNLETSYENHEWDNIYLNTPEYKRKFSEISNTTCLSVFAESKSTVETQELIYDKMNFNEWFDKDSDNELELAETTLDANATPRDREITMTLLREIHDAITNAVDDQTAYEELEKVISKNEEIILSQNWKEGENNALGAIAIAKYSTQFWKNYDFSVFSKGGKPKNPRTAVVVGADVVGYVVGGIIGGVSGTVVGTVTFGAGTVAGVLVGKVVGGFVGSGTAMTAIGIYDAWSDWFN